MTITLLNNSASSYPSRLRSSPLHTKLTPRGAKVKANENMSHYHREKTRKMRRKSHHLKIKQAVHHKMKGKPSSMNVKNMKGPSKHKNKNNGDINKKKKSSVSSSSPTGSHVSPSSSAASTSELTPLHFSFVQHHGCAYAHADNTFHMSLPLATDRNKLNSNQGVHDEEVRFIHDFMTSSVNLNIDAHDMSKPFRYNNDVLKLTFLLISFVTRVHVKSIDRLYNENWLSRFLKHNKHAQQLVFCPDGSSKLVNKTTSPRKVPSAATATFELKHPTYHQYVNKHMNMWSWHGIKSTGAIDSILKSSLSIKYQQSGPSIWTSQQLVDSMQFAHRAFYNHPHAIQHAYVMLSLIKPNKNSVYKQGNKILQTIYTVNHDAAILPVYLLKFERVIVAPTPPRM